MQRTMWNRSRFCRFLVKNFNVSVADFSSSRTNLTNEKKICIIGSGPAGFYFAQNLLKKLPDASVDMYEKLPVPYGLVRYGVAPDHPEVKNVINTFEKTASNKKFRFVGNVTLGRDTYFPELLNAYHAIVLAYGCNEDNELGIAGENLSNVISARRFVGWYNGLPEDRDLTVDLNCENVVVLGQGNVAVDVSRILLSPLDTLKVTDITDYSLDALSRSKVKTVYMVGRRGPLQAAFTIKEFREMTHLPQVQTVLQNADFRGVEELIPNLPRARRRLSELMLKTSKDPQKGDKFFKPTFLHRPVDVLGAPGNERVKAVRFELNDINHEKGTVFGIGAHAELNCGLVLRSIGYKGSCPDSKIPFDAKQGVVVNGKGVYSTGWIHTGPTGVILSTMTDAYEQSNLLVSDINSGRLPCSQTKPGFDVIKSVLKSKGIVTVDFNGWKRIDKKEVEKGTAVGKPREKIVDINEMLEIGGS